MKNAILFFLLLLPSVLIGQIIKENSVIIKDYNTERYEQSEYVLRQYEMADTILLEKLKSILTSEGSFECPEGWYYLMFVDQIQDTIILRIELQPWPYKLHDLFGFFKMNNINILVYNKLPYFLNITKLSKTFKYVRHTYKVSDNNWVEFSGDDCSHSWKLFYINNNFFSYGQ